MTDERNEETIVDVVYDEDQIFHVLEINTEGVRGVPFSQYMIRNTIATIRLHLVNLDQTKIDEFLHL